MFTWSINPAGARRSSPLPQAAGLWHAATDAVSPIGGNAGALDGSWVATEKLHGANS
jgi:hypothetical protein